jgi:predicted transcriptional regulator
MTADPDGSGAELVSAQVPSDYVARLDQMAARRGVDRDALVREAIDALLAQELWSGGFVVDPIKTDVSGLRRVRAGVRRRFGRSAPGPEND